MRQSPPSPSSAPRQCSNAQLLPIIQSRFHTIEHQGGAPCRVSSQGLRHPVGHRYTARQGRGAVTYQVDSTRVRPASPHETRTHQVRQQHHFSHGRIAVVITNILSFTRLMPIVWSSKLPCTCRPTRKSSNSPSSSAQKITHPIAGCATSRRLHPTSAASRPLLHPVHSQSWQPHTVKLQAIIARNRGNEERYQ